MPVTLIDPKCALIVIDLQKGIINMLNSHLMGDVVKQCGALLQAFRSRGLPVVLVNVDGKPSGRTEQNRSLDGLPADWSELIADLNHQSSDHLITKRTAGAFTNTDLNEYLKSAGVTQVVVVGVATSMGVESTARQAYELGYNVTVAVDAIADLSLQAHTNSICYVFPRLSETGSTEEIIALLESSIKQKVGI